MLVVMQAQTAEEQVRAVCQKIESLGYHAHSIPGAQRTAIGITGNQGEVESGTLEEMPGAQVFVERTNGKNPALRSDRFLLREGC
jgi:3-deoxy-7-phosphoheptulonate synthase